MWTYNYDERTSDELYHFGVLGMKWGRRKAYKQGKDQVTREKNRYGSRGEKRISKDIAKGYSHAEAEHREHTRSVLKKIGAIALIAGTVTYCVVKGRKHSSNILQKNGDKKLSDIGFKVKTENKEMDNKNILDAIRNRPAKTDTPKALPVNSGKKLSDIGFKAKAKNKPTDSKSILDVIRNRPAKTDTPKALPVNSASGKKATTDMLRIMQNVKLASAEKAVQDARSASAKKGVLTRAANKAAKAASGVANNGSNSDLTVRSMMAVIGNMKVSDLGK